MYFYGRKNLHVSCLCSSEAPPWLSHSPGRRLIWRNAAAGPEAFSHMTQRIIGSDEETTSFYGLAFTFGSLNLKEKKKSSSSCQECSHHRDLLSGQPGHKVHRHRWRRHLSTKVYTSKKTCHFYLKSFLPCLQFSPWLTPFMPWSELQAADEGGRGDSVLTRDFSCNEYLIFYTGRVLSMKKIKLFGLKVAFSTLLPFLCKKNLECELWPKKLVCFVFKFTSGGQFILLLCLSRKYFCARFLSLSARLSRAFWQAERPSISLIMRSEILELTATMSGRWSASGLRHLTGSYSR